MVGLVNGYPQGLLTIIRIEEAVASKSSVPKGTLGTSEMGGCLRLSLHFNLSPCHRVMVVTDVSASISFLLFTYLLSLLLTLVVACQGKKI